MLLLNNVAAANDKNKNRPRYDIKLSKYFVMAVRLEERCECFPRAKSDWKAADA